MPVRIDPPISSPPASTGRWLVSLQDDLPDLYAHAGRGTPQDDPITVFWGGATTGDQLLKFFTESVSDASSSASASPLFRTVVFAPDEEKVFIRREAAAIPSPYDHSAEFVRLEHLVAVLEDPAFQGTELLAAADYVVWARLTEPPRRVTDSIGVYVKPSRFQRVKPWLAIFVSGTTVSPMTVEQATRSLQQIDDNLWQLRK
jgi:hypothetical protein